MRLVHLSDLHLGYRQHQRQTATGENQREADVESVFRIAIAKVIALAPDVLVVAGDVFHNVRPSNPAILSAYSQFLRLTRELPRAIIVIVAGNHDTPRSRENACILRLFDQLPNVHVVDTEARRLPFPERDLSILAVPDPCANRPPLLPDPDFGTNVLVLHGEIKGVVPVSEVDSERAAVQISPEELGAPHWDYVALGHYHVCREIAPNAFYSGSIEYTSTNIWGERREEAGSEYEGKGFIEFDLAAHQLHFHPLPAARRVIDLPVIDARGLSAADLDEALRQNVAACPGGIDGAIVRQVVRNVPRHISRELDGTALRDYKRRAMNYQLETRRPDVPTANGTGDRRLSLTEMVRDKLRDRVMPSEIGRDALVQLGLHYLSEAEAAEQESLATTPESE